MIKKQPDMDCHPSEAFEYIRDILSGYISTMITPDDDIVRAYNFVEDYLFVTWG